MNNRIFHQLLFLFLVGAALFWAGCDPEDDDPVTCDDAYRSLSISDYCNPPELQTFRDLTQDEQLNDILPILCSNDYSQSRTVKIGVPPSGDIKAHIFLNFPGTLIVEAFGTNCGGTFVPLVDDCPVYDKVINIVDIDGTGFSTVYLRVLYKGQGNYIPGIRDNIDNLEFAAYEGEADLELFRDNTGENPPVYINCDGNTTNRVILSPGNNTAEPLNAAILSGLPFQSCECANGELITVSAPVGVDINTLRPKVRERTAEPDTVRTSFDFIVPLPPLTFSNDLPPGDSPYITENECLQYASSQTPSAANEGIIVTVVDSGADLDANLGEFENNSLQSQPPGCVPFGRFGADIVGGDDTPDDEVGHGTAVSSIIFSNYNGNTPLTVLNNKFFTNQGGTLFDALCASHAGIEVGSHLLNLSWGFADASIPPALESTLDRARDENVIVVTSAGNDGNFLTNFPYWPASASINYPNMLTVASYENPPSTDPDLTNFSNFDPFVVEVAALYAREALLAGSAGDVWYPAGTSISAPIVSRALVDLLSENLFFSAEQAVTTFLNQMAINAGNLEPDVIDGKYLPQPTIDNGCSLIGGGF